MTAICYCPEPDIRNSMNAKSERYCAKCGHYYMPEHGSIVPGVTAQRGLSLMPDSEKGDKIGRNEPCPCRSGKKWKHCCGQKGATRVE